MNTELWLVDTWLLKTQPWEEVWSCSCQPSSGDQLWRVTVCWWIIWNDWSLMISELWLVNTCSITCLQAVQPISEQILFETSTLRIWNWLFIWLVDWFLLIWAVSWFKLFVWIHLEAEESDESWDIKNWRTLNITPVRSISQHDKTWYQILETGTKNVFMYWEAIADRHFLHESNKRNLHCNCTDSWVTVRESIFKTQQKIISHLKKGLWRRSLKMRGDEIW